MQAAASEMLGMTSRDLGTAGTSKLTQLSDYVKIELTGNPNN